MDSRTQRSTTRTRVLWGAAVFCAMVFIGVGARPALAQGLLSYGVQLSYCDDGDLGVGARMIVATSDWVAQSRVVASFDLYFPGGTERDFPGVGTVEADPSFWEFNLNGHYVFDMGEVPLNLYAGTGVHLYDGSIEVSVPDVDVRGFDPDGSGVGLNLLGGIEFPLQSSLTPFAEFKVEVGGAEQVVITGGVRF